MTDRKTPHRIKLEDLFGRIDRMIVRELGDRPEVRSRTCEISVAWEARDALAETLEYEAITLETTK